MTIGPFDSGVLAARQLQALGIDTAYCVVAAPMIPIIQGLAAEGIRMVGCRHEQQATFMAQAWAYLRGVPGVVVVGSGPAMTNTLTSLYVARENGWPVIVLAGVAPSHERSLGTFQELDQRVLAAPLCKWTATITDVSRFPEMLRMAATHALSGRPGPVYLEMPAEVATEPSSVQPAGALVQPLQPLPRSVPVPASIEAAARAIAQARRPLMVFAEDAGWSRAEAQARALADLGLPFLASPMGRGLVPDSHPSHVGATRGYALAQADLIIAVGAKFDWMLGGFDRRQAAERDVCLIQIDPAPESFVRSADVDIMLAGDHQATLALLLDALGREGYDGAPTEVWRLALQERDRRNREQSAQRVATALARPVLTPPAIFAVLNQVLVDSDIVVTDGEVTPGAGRLFLTATTPRCRLDPGPTGCMGIGVPFAIGAALAEPHRRVFAVLGDYAFGASAMEVETAARVGANVIFIVANNGGIVGQDLQQAVFASSGQAVASLSFARYHLLADMCGITSAQVSDTQGLRAAIEDALTRGGPAVINVVLDPLEHGIARGKDYLTGGYTMRANPHRSPA